MLAKRSVKRLVAGRQGTSYSTAKFVTNEETQQAKEVASTSGGKHEDTGTRRTKWGAIAPDAVRMHDTKVSCGPRICPEASGAEHSL